MVDNSGATRISLQKGAAISTSTKILALTKKLWCTCICSWTKLIKWMDFKPSMGHSNSSRDFKFTLNYKYMQFSLREKKKKKKKVQPL